MMHALKTQHDDRSAGQRIAFLLFVWRGPPLPQTLAPKRTAERNRPFRSLDRRIPNAQTFVRTHLSLTKIKYVQEIAA